MRKIRSYWSRIKMEKLLFLRYHCQQFNFKFLKWTKSYRMKVRFINLAKRQITSNSKLRSCLGWRSQKPNNLEILLNLKFNQYNKKSLKYPHFLVKKRNVQVNVKRNTNFSNFKMNFQHANNLTIDFAKLAGKTISQIKSKFCHDALKSNAHFLGVIILQTMMIFRAR